MQIDIQVAALMARLCWLSRQPPEYIVDRLADQWVQVKFLNDPMVMPRDYGFMATDLKRVIIVFGDDDQVRHLAFSTTAIGRVRDVFGSVHAGMGLSANVAWRQISRIIRIFPNLPIVIAGWGVGGAIAQLVAVHAHLDGKTVDSIYTFGSHRVGDLEFANRFNHVFHGRAFRFVNHDDVATRTPLHRHGYRHTDQMVWLLSDGGLTTNPNAWHSFRSRIYATPQELTNPANPLLANHDICQYARVLTDLCKKNNQNQIAS